MYSLLPRYLFVISSSESISRCEGSRDIRARALAIWHYAHVLVVFPTVVRKYPTKQLREGFMLIQLGYSPLWMGRLGSMGIRRHLQSQSRRR